MLNKTRKEYKKKVEDNKKELAVVILRLLQNKKILAQVKERTRRKALCLAKELASKSEKVNTKLINYSAANALVGLSLTL